MENIRAKKGFICDMDGVIYHGNKILDGVKEFIDWLNKENKEYLFLTNSPERTPLELSRKLSRMGLEVSEDHFYTSALATAKFIKTQMKNASAYVIGEGGLMNALYDAGIYMNDVNPDYVIIGETRSYNFEKIEKAVHLVNKGARLIGANPDETGPTEAGIVPATGALIAPIEIATGKRAYFIGKPNPFIIRHAMRKLNTHSVDTVIIGDRMDTDILSGIESSIDTVLVLSGVTAKNEIDKFPYRPKYVLDGVGDILK